MRCSPILLLAASGLVGDGPLDEACLQGGVQIQSPEILFVRKPEFVHGLGNVQLPLSEHI